MHTSAICTVKALFIELFGDNRSYAFLAYSFAVRIFNLEDNMERFDLMAANKRLNNYINDFKKDLSEEQLKSFNLILNMQEELIRMNK